MSKPLIGITTGTSTEFPAYQTFTSYADAISRAGGIPVLLPYRSNPKDIPALLESIRGVVLTGGPDLDPAAWGEAVHAANTPIHPEREAYERALLSELDRRRTPTLGVCLGMQLMNVHRGGSLTQHLPDLARTLPAEHRRLQNRDARHAIQLTAGSHVARILGAHELVANSAHHQAIARLGAGLSISGHAPDGVIEAVEDRSRPFWIGVQWHPERIASEGTQLELFRHLVRAAQRSRRYARSGTNRLSVRSSASSITGLVR